MPHGHKEKEFGSTYARPTLNDTKINYLLHLHGILHRRGVVCLAHENTTYYDQMYLLEVVHKF